MSYKELLAELFVENAGCWATKHNGPKATRYYEESLKLNPKNAEVYRLYGNLNFDFAKHGMPDFPDQNSDLQEYYSHRGRKLHNKAADRLVDLPDPNQWDQINRVNNDLREYYIRQGRELHNKAIELGAAPPLPKNYWIIQEQNRKEHMLSKETKK